MNIQESRRKIDAIDEQIVALLNRRAVEVKTIGHIKSAAGEPVADEHREADIFRKITAENIGHIDNSALVRIFDQIMAESRRLQAKALLEAEETRVSAV